MGKALDVLQVYTRFHKDNHENELQIWSYMTDTHPYIEVLNKNESTCSQVIKTFHNALYCDSFTQMENICSLYVVLMFLLLVFYFFNVTGWV